MRMNNYPVNKVTCKDSMRYVFYCLVLIGTVCSAQKAEYTIVNDFIEAELKGFKYDSIHIQIESLDNVSTLKLYEQAYNERDSQNSTTAEVWIEPELKEWGFGEAEIQDVKNSLNKERFNWRRQDFKNKKFVFKNSVQLKNINSLKDHLNAGTKEYIIRISKPILSKNKKYALFQFHFSNFSIGYVITPNRGAIVMKKEKEKWVVLSSVREAAYE